LIGRPLTCHFQFYATVPPENKYQNTPWRKHPSHQGGYLLDGGVHHVAAMRLVMQSEIVEVAAHVAQFQEHLPPFDTLTASVQFRNGALGTVVISFGQPRSSPAQFEVRGSAGLIRVGRSELEVIEYLADGKDRVQPIDRDPQFETEPIRAEFASFADAITKGATHRLGVRQALQDLAVLEAIFESADRKVAIAVQQFV